MTLKQTDIHDIHIAEKQFRTGLSEIRYKVAAKIEVFPELNKIAFRGPFFYAETNGVCSPKIIGDLI